MMAVSGRTGHEIARPGYYESFDDKLHDILTHEVVTKLKNDTKTPINGMFKTQKLFDFRCFFRNCSLLF